MAVSGQIGEGVIKIALAGLDAAKKQLASIADTTQKVGKELSSIGTIGTVGFASLTASVTGFLKAADPVRFEIFSLKIKILSMYIGLSFIPILQDAIDLLDKLIEFFKNLSDEQRDNIEHWTKIALEITGVVAAITTFSAIVSKAIGIIRALSVVIGLLEAETGIGLVLALAGVAFGVLELTGGMEKLKPIIEKVEKVFQQLMDAVLGPLMDVLQQVADTFISAFEEVAKAIVPLFKMLGDVFVSLFTAVKPIIEQLSEIFKQFVKELVPIFEDLAKQFVSVIGEFLPIIQELGKAFSDLVSAVAPVLMQLIPPLVQIGLTFVKLYVLYESTLAKMWLMIASAVAKVLPTFIEIWSQVAEVIGELMPTFVELANTFAELGKVIGDLAGSVMGELVGVFGEILQLVAQLTVSFYKLFGPVLIALIRGTVGIIKGVMETIIDLVNIVIDGINRAIHALNHLNPGKDIADIGKIGKPGEGGGAGGGGDYGGGDEDDKKPEGKKPGWLSGILHHDKTEKAEKEANRFKPLPTPVKVEHFGLEDAFKRAQVGANFDPTKLAEQERNKLLGKSADHLESIDAKLKPEPSPAMAAF